MDYFEKAAEAEYTLRLAPNWKELTGLLVQRAPVQQNTF
jgi:hypothetical protein